MQTKPDGQPRGVADDVLMSLRDVQVHYQLRGGNLSRLFGVDTGTVKAVDGVNVELRKGEVLGLVGESGSGKTTLGRALLGLVSTTSGEIDYGGRSLGAYSQRELRSVRRELQMVFQDPHAALNPAMNIETAVGHPLKIHRLVDANQVRSRVVDALEQVGLAPAERFLNKFPSDLSGGQKQRAVLARAIIMSPTLLVADEPVSALDMSVRAKILQLMLDLKRDLNLTYVYITHDLATAKFFCDRIAIMYLGRIVEIGDTESIFAAPKHPYTQSLLSAIPELDPDSEAGDDLPRGEIPDAASPPLGCAFHPRCPHAFDMCGWESRDLRTLIERHWLNEDAFHHERKLVHSLDQLDEPSHRASLKAGQGASPDDIQALLDRARAEDPDEPLWRGVSSTETTADGVDVEFYSGADPGLRSADGVQVACHLYPPS